MHLISYPGQVCLSRPGWYERCVVFSSNKPVTEVCSSRSALPTSDCDSERGAWSIALMEHYSCLAILCNAAAALPVAVSRLWVCIHPHTDTKSFTCLKNRDEAHICWRFKGVWWFFPPIDNDARLLRFMYLQLRHNKLLSEEWSTFSLEQGIKSYPCFSAEEDWLNAENKWNLWNVSPAINHTEVSPTGTHYDLHCNPELWESQRKRR